MDALIPIEIDRERDVAYIHLATHGPLRRIYKSVPVGLFVLDIDDDGDLVGIELLSAYQQLRRLGVHYPRGAANDG